MIQPLEAASKYIEGSGCICRVKDDDVNDRTPTFKTTDMLERLTEHLFLIVYAV